MEVKWVCDAARMTCLPSVRSSGPPPDRLRSCVMMNPAFSAPNDRQFSLHRAMHLCGARLHA